MRFKDYLWIISIFVADTIGMGRDYDFRAQGRGPSTFKTGIASKPESQMCLGLDPSSVILKESLPLSEPVSFFHKKKWRHSRNVLLYQ